MLLMPSFPAAFSVPAIASPSISRICLGVNFRKNPPPWGKRPGSVILLAA